MPKRFQTQAKRPSPATPTDLIWHNEKRKIADLNPADYNPRIMTQRQAEDLTISIEKFAMADPIVINLDNTIIGGHMRINVLKTKAVEEVDCRVPNRLLTKPEERELNLRLNKNMGEFNWDMLANMDEDLLKNVGFTIDELAGIFGAGADAKEAKKKLQEVFLIPPTTIFDTRQGYWQERRRQWLTLGIQGEIGRDNNLLQFSEMAQIKKKAYGHQMNDHRTGTSIFDPVLCEIIYRWFNIAGGLILDPFAGGSVRGIVAGYLGYGYNGIELSGIQVAENKKQGDKILGAGQKEVIWHNGDARHSPDFFTKKGDLIFTCPPYYDLEVYSDNQYDLSTAGTYEEFLDAYRLIINRAVEKLNDNRFACYVVADIRDKKGFYRNFITDTILAFKQAGMMLYNEAILINAMGSLPIRLDKQFRFNRKLGKTHQNVLIFYKGDPKKIKEIFGDVTVGIADAKFNNVPADSEDA